MKRVLVVGLVIAVLSLAGLAIPVFARGSGNGGAPPTNQGAWEAMHDEGFGYMPCHGYYAPDEGGPYDAWSGIDDHMGGGMMG